MQERGYELRRVDVRIKLVDEAPLYSDRPITSPDMAIDVMRKALAEMDREYCAVVNMDVSGRPLNFNVVSVGDLNQTVAPMQNIFKAAILSNAHSIMMFHNHPDGTLTPSRADLITTSKLIEAGNLMNISVKDHIIIGGGTGEFYSMRQNHGGMFPDKASYPEHTVEPTVKLAERVVAYKEKLFMNVTDYAATKDVDVHIINGYISAHRDEFQGHIARNKKSAALDDWARKKLDDYIATRPNKGVRFHRFERKVKEMDIMEKLQDKDRELLPKEVDEVLNRKLDFYVPTNVGNMPIRDYVEMRAWETGFDSYADMRKEGIGVSMSVSSLSLEDGSPIMGDSELGVDVPDMREGFDDMDAVSTSQPSMNVHKSRVSKVKHYSSATKNDEIENMKETEERLSEDYIKNTEIDLMEDPDFDDFDELEKD
ncbi:MAG: JAB domain-containing protein [Butyrivibrio sp.]|nr:JAB domain-containing protein [Butyrivibrio sp.]